MQTLGCRSRHACNAHSVAGADDTSVLTRMTPKATWLNHPPSWISWLASSSSVYARHFSGLMTPGLVPPSLSSNHLRVTLGINELQHDEKRVQGICSSRALLRPQVVIGAFEALGLVPPTSVQLVKVHTNSTYMCSAI